MEVSIYHYPFPSTETRTRIPSEDISGAVGNFGASTPSWGHSGAVRGMRQSELVLLSEVESLRHSQPTNHTDKTWSRIFERYDGSRYMFRRYMDVLWKSRKSFAISKLII